MLLIIALSIILIIMVVTAYRRSVIIRKRFEASLRGINPDVMHDIWMERTK